jgi:hypothetical protein
MTHDDAKTAGGPTGDPSAGFQHGGRSFPFAEANFGAFIPAWRGLVAPSDIACRALL